MTVKVYIFQSEKSAKEAENNINSIKIPIPKGVTTKWCESEELNGEWVIRHHDSLEEFLGEPVELTL